MHPLEAINEAELSGLIRVADRLLHTHRLLAPGHRPYRRRAGFGIEFLDHREFSPGDDLRNIDWRATARSRHPQIRRYCDEAAADWFVVLDCSASMIFDKGEKWALAVQCAAAMAYLLIHLGNRIGILLFSNRIEQMVPLGRGYGHYGTILQTLRRFTPALSGGGSDLRSCVAHIRRHSPAFVISDFLTPDGMRGGLEALTLRGDRLHALQILSDRENHYPEASPIRLRDVETGQTLTVELDNQQATEHRLALDGFCNALSGYCRKQGVRFSRHQASEGWKDVLANHLRGESNRS
jgi:uncharacterized protein (DUF58 family)